MPGHETHDKVGLFSIIPIAGISLYLTHSLVDTGILAVGIGIGTYFLSPDLDLHSRIYLRWGLLRWIWIPYQKLIPHRSWLSHSGPISATLRIVYLSAWILPVLHLFGVSVYDLHFTVVYAILWIALIIADSLHVLMDMIWKDT